MKKILLFVATAAVMLSCSKDALYEAVSPSTDTGSTEETRVGYRMVTKAGITVANKTRTAADYMDWGVESINFYGDAANTRSQIYATRYGSGPYLPNDTIDEEFLTNRLVALQSANVDGIEIVFDELNTPPLSNVKYKIWASVGGNNGRIIKTTTPELIDPVEWGDTHTHTVSLAGIAQQNDYSVWIYVEIYEAVTVAVYANYYNAGVSPEATPAMWIDDLTFLGANGVNTTIPHTLYQIPWGGGWMENPWTKYWYVDLGAESGDYIMEPQTVVLNSTDVTGIRLDNLELYDMDHNNVSFDYTIEVSAGDRLQYSAGPFTATTVNQMILPFTGLYRHYEVRLDATLSDIY